MPSFDIQITCYILLMVFRFVIYFSKFELSPSSIALLAGTVAYMGEGRFGNVTMFQMELRCTGCI